MRWQKSGIAKIMSWALIFSLFFQQAGFAQSAGLVDISRYINQLAPQHFLTQVYHPAHLRALSYDPATNKFGLLLDKGNSDNLSGPELEESTQELMKYFLVGISLPNSVFWVNLQPEQEDKVIDPALAQTDVGRIMLAADLELKKDTAYLISAESPEGKEYWNKVYKKAGELFGFDTLQIPTMIRPWIVPDEIILRQANGNAYIYKATLKVMLEQDHLNNSALYSFKDERMKALNEYAAQLARTIILPKLTQAVNTDKKYASLRQVYYSLILAQWFKLNCANSSGGYADLVDRGELNGLTSKDSWSPSTYFEAYQRSFANGEYHSTMQADAGSGATMHNIVSGGVNLASSPATVPILSFVGEMPRNPAFLELESDGVASRITGPASSPLDNGSTYTSSLRKHYADRRWSGEERRSPVAVDDIREALSSNGFIASGTNDDEALRTAVTVAAALSFLERRLDVWGGLNDALWSVQYLAPDLPSVGHTRMRAFTAARAALEQIKAEGTPDNPYLEEPAITDDLDIGSVDDFVKGLLNRSRGLSPADVFGELKELMAIIISSNNGYSLQNYNTLIEYIYQRFAGKYSTPGDFLRVIRARTIRVGQYTIVPAKVSQPVTAMEALLSPQGIAVIGATNTPGKLGRVLMRNLHGFKGGVYPVNAVAANKGELIDGKRVYTSVTDIDGRVDTAVVVVPAEHVLAVVDQIIAKESIRFGIIITAGFGEVGQEGAELERQIQERVVEARRNGRDLHIIGPNCFGMAIPGKGLNLTFGGEDFTEGNIAYGSQSGAFALLTGEILRAAGLGFSVMMSLGNKMDFNEAAFIEAAERDPNTKVIVLYLEDIKDGAAFLNAARHATKPILVFKANQTPLGEAAAATHTAALGGGAHGLFMAAAEQAGVIVADSLREYYEFMIALSNGESIDRRKNRPGVDTVSKHRPGSSVKGNLPIDVIGDATIERYRDSLNLLLQSPEVKSILVIVLKTSPLDVEATAVMLAEMVREHPDKLIVPVYMGAGPAIMAGRAILDKAGITTFQFPEDGLKYIESRGIEEIAVVTNGGGAGVATADAIYKMGLSLTEFSSELLAGLRKVLPPASNVHAHPAKQGTAAGRQRVTIPEDEVTAMLEAQGIQYPKHIEVPRSTDEEILRGVLAAGAAIGYEDGVVLKVIGSEIPHKSRMGGVAVNIRSEEELKRAWLAMSARMREQGLPVEGYMVVQQARPGREILVGIQRDKVFGVVLTIGLGGVNTEALNDAVKIILTGEMNEYQKREAIRQRMMKLHVYLDLVKEGLDLNAIIDVAMKLYKIGVDDPSIESVEINPIRVYKQGYIALDALMVRGRRQTATLEAAREQHQESVEYKPQDDAATPSSSPVEGDGRKTGGVDFRAMPLPSPMGAIDLNTLQIGHLENANPTELWKQVTTMVDDGVIPASEQIAACAKLLCRGKDCRANADKLRSCIAGMMRLQEERVIPTEELLKQVLIALECTIPVDDDNGASVEDSYRASNQALPADEPMRLAAAY